MRPKDAPGVTRSQVLDALRSLIADHGYSPTVRELATACGINPSTCYKHLSQLMADGKVTEQAGQARTLRVVDPDRVGLGRGPSTTAI